MADEVIGRAILSMEVDGTEAVSSMAQLEATAGRAERVVSQKAGQMAAELAGVGKGASAGAGAVDRATQQLRSSIERATAAFAGGTRGSAAFFESLAKQRSANLDVLRPYLDQLDKAKTAQEEVARAALVAAEKQKVAAAAVAENRRAFEQDNSAREAYLNKLREEVKLLGMSEAAQRSYRAALANRSAGGGSEGEALLQQLERLRNAQERAAQAARDRAQAEREAAAVKRGNDDFITSLKRQADAVGKTRADLLEMEAAQRKLSAQAAPFIAKLRESERALGGVGVSAGQTKAALAQLPAQFTDIATQLAGGQNPLLILIQQGGQIRDSFGGVGNALRSIVSIIKPATIAFGGLGLAIGATALAYAQGSKEQDAFARGLILTGNSVGETVGSINAMAQAISKIAGTQGKAAEVLTSLVNAGGVAGGALQKAAEAAIKLERVGGPAIAETVKQFSELGKSPLQAAVALNEKTGFLTRSIYEQIKALEQSGNVAQAARVAQIAYADALEGRTGQLEARLGTFEKAWRTLGDAAKGAWDKMLNIGRPTTLEDEVKQAEEALNAAERRLTGRSRRGGTGAELRGPGGAEELADAQALLQTKREGVRLSERQAEADAGRAAQTKALAETEALVTAGLSSQTRLTKDLEAARNRMELAGRDPKDIQSALAAITQGSAAFQQAIGAQLATLRNATDEMVRSAQATGAAIESQFRRGLLSEVEFIERSRDAALQANAAQIDATAKELGIAKQKRENAAEQIALQGRLNALLAEQVKIATDADNKLAENRARLNRQADLFFAGEREQGQQESTAFLVAEEAKRAAIVQAIADQARALKDVNREMALEASLLGRSSSARSVAIQQLRIRNQLEREIERIRNAGFDSSARDDAIAKATANANKAIANVATQANINFIADLLDPTRAKTFGEALTDAFEGAGNALVKLTNTLEDYASKRLALEERLADIKSDPQLDETTKQKGINAVIEERARLQVDSYASMAGAAKTFFEENSKGYKALEAAETAFRAFQLAEALATTTRKLFFTQAEVAAVVAAEGAKTAAITAGTATQVAADQVKGASAAAVGVATQAQGEPYTAFARMAAMAAAMAALGFATGAFGNKGGGTQATAGQRQAGSATGRLVTAGQQVSGTVFGNDEARSESIKNTLEILKDTTDLQTPILATMRDSLLSIENSLAGLGNLVVRAGGITTGKNLGIKTGTIAANTGDPLTKALGFDTSGLDKFVFPGLGGVISKLQAAWGKTTQEIVDSGLAIMGSVADLVAGRGVQQFADVKTTTSSFFGLSKKTTESTAFGSVDDDIAAQFGLVFKSIGDVLVDAAGTLGRNGDTMKDSISAFVVDIPRLSLKDLKGEELQDAINAAIGAAADDLASTLIPGLDEFRQVGEGYFETLVRVSAGIETASFELDMLGVAAINFADIARKQGDVGAEIVRQSLVAAETVGDRLSGVGKIVGTLSGSASDIADTYQQLVDVRDVLKSIGTSGEELSFAMLRGAGGLDALQASAETFFESFFSEQERLNANAQRLSEDFAKLGVAMPASREAFRDLVLGIDRSTEAGQRLFGQLLGLADAVDKVAAAAEESASRRSSLEIELLRAQGRNFEAVNRERQIELDALRRLDPALVGIQEEIYRLIDAADIMQGVTSVVDDFLSGDALASFFGDRINEILTGAGFDPVSVEQLLGITRDDITDLFNLVGTQGKQALLDALPLWERLIEAVNADKIKALIDGIASSADELLAAYNEINPAADTLVTAWKKNKDEIKLITDALNDLKGVKAGTAIEQMVAELEEAVTKRDRLRDVLSTNRDTALDILAGQGTQAGVDALRKREAELWKEFASTQSPEVAQAVTKVTLDRIRLEGTVAQKALQAKYDAEFKAAQAAFDLRQQTVTLEEQLIENQKDALREQIEGYKKLKEAAASLPEFVGGLRAGNLSNLSFTDRLAQQKTLFEDALKTGNDPQGQLTAYLQQAQQLFGGATKLYSDIFVQAVAQYEAAIKDAAKTVDPALAAAQSQLNALEALVEKAPELKQAVVDTSQAEIDALLGPGGINERVGLGLTKVDATIATLQTALEKKLGDLIAKQDLLEKAINDVGREVLDLRKGPATETATNTRRVADTLELAGAEPRVSGR